MPYNYYSAKVYLTNLGCYFLLFCNPAADIFVTLIVFNWSFYFCWMQRFSTVRLYGPRNVCVRLVQPCSVSKTVEEYLHRREVSDRTGNPWAWHQDSVHFEYHNNLMHRHTFVRRLVHFPPIQNMQYNMSTYLIK